MLSRVGNVTGDIALPSVVIDGSAYPASTLSSVYYVDGDSALTANFYRSGSTTGVETDVLTVVGVLSKQ
jgi:hypothetical protein